MSVPSRGFSMILKTSPKVRLQLKQQKSPVGVVSVDQSLGDVAGLDRNILLHQRRPNVTLNLVNFRTELFLFAFELLQPVQLLLDPSVHVLSRPRRVRGCDITRIFYQLSGNILSRLSAESRRDTATTMITRWHS